MGAAHKYDYYQTSPRKIKDKKLVNKQLAEHRKKIKIQQFKIRWLRRLATTAMMVSIASVLLFNLHVLHRYAYITEQKHQVLKLEKTLEQLENKRDNLSVEIERKSKLDSIEEHAKNNLNMKYPERSQIIYISVDKSSVDLIESKLASNEVIDNKKSWASNLVYLITGGR